MSPVKKSTILSINNVVKNNGGKNGGYGFSFNGKAMDVLLDDNIIRDNKNGTQKAAIYISKNSPPQGINNKMSGHKLGNIVYEKYPHEYRSLCFLRLGYFKF